MDGDAFRAGVGGGHFGSPSPAAPYMSRTAGAGPTHAPFSVDAGLQLHLFGNATGVPPVGPAGYYNYSGNNHHAVTNQAANASVDRGDEKRLKLQMSLNNNYAHVGNPGAVSTGLRLSYEDDERNSSVTSAGGSMSSSMPTTTTTSFAADLMAQMDKENKEINHYLRVQAEQIGKEIKEVNQRRLITFLANVERAVGKKLREKELEAEAMNRKSKELTEQIRKVAMEVQSWQSAALYNQSVANNLKSRLMQAVAQNTNLTREGSGDSEEVNNAAVDAAPGGFFKSSVLQTRSTVAGLVACRLCRGREASVLVMPCRHLCLCMDCERDADVCPVCRFPKSGSVEINMSSS